MTHREGAYLHHPGHWVDQEKPLLRGISGEIPRVILWPSQGPNILVRPPRCWVGWTRLGEWLTRVGWNVSWLGFEPWVAGRQAVCVWGVETWCGQQCYQ